MEIYPVGYNSQRSSGPLGVYYQKIVHGEVVRKSKEGISRALNTATNNLDASTKAFRETIESYAHSSESWETKKFMGDLSQTYSKIITNKVKLHMSIAAIKQGL